MILLILSRFIILFLVLVPSSFLPMHTSSMPSSGGQTMIASIPSEMNQSEFRSCLQRMEQLSVDQSELDATQKAVILKIVLPFISLARDHLMNVLRNFSVRTDEQMDRVLYVSDVYLAAQGRLAIHADSLKTCTSDTYYQWLSKLFTIVSSIAPDGVRSCEV